MTSKFSLNYDEITLGLNVKSRGKNFKKKNDLVEQIFVLRPDRKKIQQPYLVIRIQAKLTKQKLIFTHKK